MIDLFNGGQTHHRWSCGRTTKIKPRDRFYLIKRGLGHGARGLFGAGTILSTPYEAAHYAPDKESEGASALYVDVEFEDLRNPTNGIVVDRDDLLNDPELAWAAWDVTGGGKKIPDAVAVELDRRWPMLVGRVAITYPDDVSTETPRIEGAVVRVEVNRYERDPVARQQCLADYGYACRVCEFHFERVYGSMGRKYIHVHHLVPIASIGKEYQVDPIKDLIPVCPNCHAMLHQGKTPPDVNALRDLVHRYRS